MNRNLIMLALAIPLLACGGPSVDEENASVAEVSERVREASEDGGLLRPGRWSTTVSIEEMDMPGVPPEAAEQMKRMVAQTHTAESCLTPEEARRPKGDFFGGSENCRYEHFRMGGGRIDAQMRCQQDGSTQRMEMAGTYSPEAYQMRMKATTEAGGQSEAMTMRMKVEAERVGECDGKQA